MSSTQLFANNAYSTLLAGITSGATSCAAQAGEGARFPAPTGVQFFMATIFNNAGAYEVVKVTARTSDTFTIVRAQESTTAAAWNAGDHIKLHVTQGTLAGLAQKDNDESITGGWTFVKVLSVVGLKNYGTAAGTDTYTAALGLSALVAGTEFKLKFTNANGSATPTLAVDSYGAKTIVRPDGSALTAGDIPANGICSFLYDGTNMVLLNPFWAGWKTGNGKIVLDTAADSGWVMADDGTIGSATSGATTRANADCQSFYTLLWNNVSNTYAPVTGGRGANAAADWAANKSIALTKMLGRALAIAGAGAGLTSRTLGQILGEEAHALTAAENGPHTQGVSSTDAGLNPPASGPYVMGTSTLGDAGTINTSSSGSGTAHNTMQPTSFINIMIKL